MAFQLKNVFSVSYTFDGHIDDNKIDIVAETVQEALRKFTMWRAEITRDRPSTLIVTSVAKTYRSVLMETS